MTSIDHIRVFYTIFTGMTNREAMKRTAPPRPTRPSKKKQHATLIADKHPFFSAHDNPPCRFCANKISSAL
jgi:hypothetical protein